jgi:glycosyltransferase involved in cell wall biosynthesis
MYKDKQRAKILFFCFGFSIHALRRVSIFAEDSRFEVYLVSNYNYSIPNATTICLTANTYDKIKFKDDVLLSIVSYVLVLLNLVLFKAFKRKFILLGEFISIINDYHFIKRNLKDFKPDVIFLQTLLYPSYIAFLFKKKIPVIITFWNGDVIWWASSKGFERRLKKKIVQYGSKRAKLITVNSETAFKTCQSYGVKINNIRKILYPAVDLQIFKPISKTVARTRLKLTNRHIILCPRGFHGTSDYLNNDIILIAFSKVQEKYTDSLLLFTNGLDDRTWDDYFFKSYNIKYGSTKCVSYVNWTEMPYFYSSADLAISLSSNDSLPNSMLEAMACNIPLIMGDIPQIREWLTDDVNGMLCPVTDSELLYQKIISVLENKNGCIDRFVKYNSALISKNFDSMNNIETIKNLVISMI